MCRASGLGHATVIADDADPPRGCGRRPHRRHGSRPRRRRLGRAGARRGFGAQRRRRADGAIPGRGMGRRQSPVFLTSTMQVGRVYDAACRLLMDEQPRIGVDDVVIPIVGECDDSWLTDTRRMHVQDGRRCGGLGGGAGARSAATTSASDAVGAGTGMCCLGWKGGIGSCIAGAARRPRRRDARARQLRVVGSAHDRRSGGWPRAGRTTAFCTATRRVV